MTRRRRPVPVEAQALRDEVLETRRVLGETAVRIQEFTKLIEEMADDDS